MDYYKEVLHGVLYPEAHENGIIKKYNMRYITTTWSVQIFLERLERNQLRIRRVLPYRIAPPVDVDTSIRPHLE